LASHSIPAPLARALAERGYDELTPVQQAVLAPDAAGRDLLVSAQTGSGKTVAFGVGIAETLLGGEDRLPSAGEPLALIVAPTRELALQVQRELEWLYAPAAGRVVASVGGMDPRRERRLLEAGAHLVVGTPGRLKDHIERGALKLGSIRAVVLDEADEMLDLGFRDDLEFILEQTPESRRTLLFSATLPKAIVALAGKFQKDAHRIAASGGERGHADIEHRAVRTEPREVEHAVVNLLRQADSPASIIFCNTRDGVRHLHATLVERGFSAVYLSGELGQNERNQALQALRDGRARICVATDVAARGIDLPNLNLVIHADLPLNAEILQHRSGRTGRAGRKGVSVLIVPHSRRRKAERLIAEAKLRPEWSDPPTAEAIRLLDRERFLDDPLLAEDVTDEDRAMAAFLLERKSATDIAALLAKLYRSRLPEPEELSEPAPLHPPRGDRAYRRDRDFEAQSARERDDPAPRLRHGRPEPEPLREAADRVIFRMDVGRRHKADPKWLLPMICRRGNVSRKEIGTIRILEDETEFEIAREAAEHFALHARRKDGEDIVITQAGEQAARQSRDGAARKPFRKRPQGQPPRPEREPRPYPGKPRGKPGAKTHARSGFAHRKKSKD
jgi:ATP-dependent RNA helicase DeaD